MTKRSRLLINALAFCFLAFDILSGYYREGRKLEILGLLMGVGGEPVSVWGGVATRGLWVEEGSLRPRRLGMSLKA